jgi:hypothetical protein
MQPSWSPPSQACHCLHEESWGVHYPAAHKTYMAWMLRGSMGGTCLLLEGLHLEAVLSRLVHAPFAEMEGPP